MVAGKGGVGGRWQRRRRPKYQDSRHRSNQSPGWRGAKRGGGQGVLGWGWPVLVACRFEGVEGGECPSASAGMGGRRGEEAQAWNAGPGWEFARGWRL